MKNLKIFLIYSVLNRVTFQPDSTIFPVMYLMDLQFTYFFTQFLYITGSFKKHRLSLLFVRLSLICILPPHD